MVPTTAFAQFYAYVGLNPHNEGVCGRYASYLTDQELMDAFDIAVLANDVRLLPPSWNVAPTQAAVVVTAEDAPRAWVATWGLVPVWAKDPSIGSRMINARSETVADKPAFRSAFSKRRCVVPASGYYEWQRTGTTKTPHFIYDASGAPLAFAGLWENGTFTVLTTEARGDMASIHDRQPVMLTSENVPAWLDTASSPAELHAVIAAPHPELAWHIVGSAVGNVRNNEPVLVEPVN